MIKIWDLWVRLFHWSLVIAISFLLFSGETGTGFFDWHRVAGEFVLGLILFRVLWGVVGSSNARLSGLIINPLLAITHLREVAARKTVAERGHNAAGGWAVLVMLLLIGIQAATGMFIADEEEWVEGAFYGVLSSANTDIIYKVHHINASLLQLVVLVHVVMVAVYFFYAKQNLIKPMITGNMNWLSADQPPAVQFRGFFTGLVLAVIVFGVVAIAVNWL